MLNSNKQAVQLPITDQIMSIAGYEIAAAEAYVVSILTLQPSSVAEDKEL